KFPDLRLARGRTDRSNADDRGEGGERSTRVRPKLRKTSKRMRVASFGVIARKHQQRFLERGERREFACTQRLCHFCTPSPTGATRYPGRLQAVVFPTMNSPATPVPSSTRNARRRVSSRGPSILAHASIISAQAWL